MKYRSRMELTLPLERELEALDLGYLPRMQQQWVELKGGIREAISHRSPNQTDRKLPLTQNTLTIVTSSNSHIHNILPQCYMLSYCQCRGITILIVTCDFAVRLDLNEVSSILCNMGTCVARNEVNALPIHCYACLVISILSRIVHCLCSWWRA